MRSASGAATIVAGTQHLVFIIEAPLQDIDLFEEIMGMGRRERARVHLHEHGGCRGVGIDEEVLDPEALQLRRLPRDVGAAEILRSDPGQPGAVGRDGGFVHSQRSFARRSASKMAAWMLRPATASPMRNSRKRPSGWRTSSWGKPPSSALWSTSPRLTEAGFRAW